MSETKFYKITNKNECHNDYQYTDGLNILPDTFIENKSCGKGGFYFADVKNILKFLDFGIYLREITLPTTNPDFKMVQVDDKYKSNMIILGKKYSLFEPETFQKLINEKASLVDSKECISNFVIKHNKPAIFELVKRYVNFNRYDFNHSHLYKACTNGCTEIVKFLAELKFNLQNETAFTSAVDNNHTEIVKIIIQNGVDIHYGKDYALKWASHFGNLDLVKFLVENGAYLYSESNTALKWAINQGHLDVAQFLLESGANINAGNGCIMKKVLCTFDFELIKRLISLHPYLRLHVDNDLIKSVVDNKNTGLITAKLKDYEILNTNLINAVYYNNVYEVKKYIEQGANVHIRNNSPLQLAAANGYSEICEILIQHGADVRANGDKAVCLASKNNHLDTLKILIKASADMRTNMDYPLRWSARNGHAKIVKFLLKKGANVHAKKEYAMRWSTRNNYPKVISLLIDAGSYIKVNKFSYKIKDY